jgi:hypothetical protein
MIRNIISFLRKEGVATSFFFILLCLIAALVACFFVVIIYSQSLPSNSKGACAILFMVAASSYTIGNILGFLFGIPKTVQDERKASQTGKVGYQVNTSLEQISDWLTKMIVGAGLVELKDIKTALVNISVKVASDIDNPKSQSIIISAIICFLILGFFVTYLSTRLYIANALASANTELEETSENNPMGN